jgi:osmoprotectant transport system permease protein
MMDFPAAVVAWLMDPSHWQGSDGIPTRIMEHLWLSAVSLAFSILIGVPVGLWLGHTGRGQTVIINVANVGRALPSLAILALALPLAFALGLGLGFWPTTLAMVPLGIPPILTNTYVGVRGVDPDMVEVAYGMGMRGRQVLRTIELPLAAGLMIAGIRNAAVAIVATATLGALVASGGLGRYIVDGLARQEMERLFVGALLVALLSIVTESTLGGIERLARRANGEAPTATADASPSRSRG